MNQTRGVLKILLTMGIFMVAPCFGGPIGSVDTSCNPTVETPAAGGCTWYNFYAFEGGSITTGSSFQNYYVESGNPDWTITTSGNSILRVLDGGHQGDTFQVLDNQISLGLTSPTPIDDAHACENDPTGPGFDPAACWNDSLMSRGTFALAPGSHSLSVVWVQRVPGGPSSLQWFEIGADPAVAAPEPAPLLLTGSGLIAIVRLVRGRGSSGS